MTMSIFRVVWCRAGKNYPLVSPVKDRFVSNVKVYFLLYLPVQQLDVDLHPLRLFPGLVLEEQWEVQAIVSVYRIGELIYRG